MSIDARTLYALLPSVYRNRDADAGGPLQALVQVVAEQLALLEDNLAQLYDDQFIETCSDWVVPYIGDLIGYRQLRGGASLVSSPRAEVADTIRLRRGKGTAATLETLARDVTGWDAHVVEMVRRLATAQYMNRVRAAAPVFPDLRDPAPLENVGRAFDPLPHTIEVRNAASGRGWYDIANIVIFLWRLQAYPIVSATATQVDAQRFLFSPYGIPVPLFSKPISKEPGALATTPLNVGQPLSRLAVAAEPDQYYGSDKSVFIQGVALANLSICNLSDAGGGAWAHTPAAGAVAIDPVLGRIAFGTAPAAAPVVTYHYGFSADLGGGSYDRLASFQNLSPVVAVPGSRATVQAALNAVVGGGAVEIGTSGRFAETIKISPTANGAIVELRAADQMVPFIALGGDLLVRGANAAQVCLNGLWIAGGRVRVAAGAENQLTQLALRHCTLVPGISRAADRSAAQPDAPSLVIETGVTLVIDRCILGGIRVAPGARVIITNSIIDANRIDGVAYAGLDGTAPGAPLSITSSTVIGKVHTSELQLASNTIFAAAFTTGDTWSAPLWAETRSSGCTRFCYVPPGSRVPRPYRCQPGASASTPGVVAPQPVFTSQRFADPGYCQLSMRTPPGIRCGADNGSEIGAFQSLAQMQREANLRVRLDEYLRFNLEAALVYVT
jgi:hypothetical protein